MSMLMLLVFLIGAVLGMRFRVLVLVPAIGFASIVVLAACFVGGESLSVTMATTILTASGLQIGYLGGVATRYTTALARTSRLRQGALENASRPSAPATHSTGGAPSTAYRG
jgi:hypothetical protein